MSKEYGKLSDDQFRRLIAQLPEMRASIQDLPEILRSTSSEKVKCVLDEGIDWAAFYELPLVQHVALGFYLLGQKERLKEICQAADPQEELLELIERGDVSELGSTARD